VSPFHRVGIEVQRSPQGPSRFRVVAQPPEPNHHFRTSSYCWAMYLRLLKQNLEAGLFVVYEKRLDV
jgi:hypothetical protein